MTKQTAAADFFFDQEKLSIECNGSWSISKIRGVVTRFKSLTLSSDKKYTISGKHLTQFDSAGALALMHCTQFLKAQGNAYELTDFNAEQLSLIDLICSKEEVIQYKVPDIKTKNILYIIGEESIYKLKQANDFVTLLGNVSIKFAEACTRLRRFQLPSIVSIINSAGLQALPILALLSFLIGIVLAYQMGLQLQNYGANNLIAYLSGMAVFREFAPLITSIIIAGRTSSAFTAQLGSMKINEEIDALHTMGLSPVELLVMPKVLGLILVFPLLIFWADIFGVLGAMIMSKGMLEIDYVDYLVRVRDSVGLKQMMLGLYKAPAFAIIISMVGCFQGFLVQANADSVGSQTTKSVVQALFFIIVADAAFSIVYSWMGL